MKVGIVVPYSWSFWGAVNEHAELQAEALRKLGIESRTLIGNDPPGNFTRVLHPRHGRHGNPPDDVLAVGRSVIVPANASLPNIVLSPRAILRVRNYLARERFDAIHLHEPMTPVTCVSALAFYDGPSVATFHASGDLGWLRLAKPMWGFLMDRLDRRIAVSAGARDSAQAHVPGHYEIIPNGVLIPQQAAAGDRQDTVVFIGRHDRRKGLPVLLRAWAEIHRRTGHRLRVVGADPLSVRLLLARGRVSDEGIDLLGFLSQEALTAELLATKALVAPSLGGESFGMVLTRGFACATPVVASDIDGYRDVMTPEIGQLVPPDDPSALTEAVVRLIEDEPRRRRLGAAARVIAEERYSWDAIGGRLAALYEEIVDGGRMGVGGPS